MANLQRTFISQEEYLQIERTTTVRSEYFNGQLLAMSSLNERVADTVSVHDAIQANLSRAIQEQLSERGSGQCFTDDQRVFVADKNFYTYPDLALTAGEPQFSDDQVDTLLNPTVLIEVSSAGSSNYDRGSKFENYRSLESLQEYLVVDSRRIYAELWRKNESQHWALVLQAEHGSDMVHLQSIDAYLLIDDVYNQIENLPEEEFTIR